MIKKKLFAIAIALNGLLLVLLGFATMASGQARDTSLPSTLSGVVRDANGVIADAVVQIQGTPTQTLTAEDGSFTFAQVSSPLPLVLSAWSEGHYVGWTTVDPGQPDWNDGTGIVITMRILPEGDDSTYAWFTKDGIEGSASCDLCHRENTEWREDAHSRAAVNERFLTLYTGADVDGNQGQLTDWGLIGARPPDPDKPYYGPGFRLDFPNRAGNCATCHTPLVSTAPTNQNCGWSGCHTDLTIERANGVIAQSAIPISAHGVSLDGISCEFCHKTLDVIVNPDTGLPHPDMPGILSMKLTRPSDESEQVFYGTVLDVNVNDSYLPLLSESRFCAGCHYGVMGGVVGMGEVTGGALIYNSYGEWLDSPYSNPVTGKTCQDCHMPVSEANWSVRLDKGGLARDYMEFNNHTMPGVTDENLLQNSVTMTSTAERSGEQLQVQVDITNDQTGHSIPTDTPIRSMILVVEALDADGSALTLDEGPVNPDYSGDLGGLPGKTFAKILRDDWTGEMPTAAIWRPVTIVEDSRIVALATDTTRYSFDAPLGETVTVNVRLIFRRAFSELSEQKGWNDPDILMEDETLHVEPD